jgi:ribosomal protein S8
LLIVKEREREFRDFNKLEKEAQRVFEKNMKSRPNRNGVIRQIRDIKASKSTNALQRVKLIPLKNLNDQD